jgi:hypothetical protein
MDVKLVLSIVVAAGMVVAAVFERRANKARARAAETAPSGVIIVVKVPESVAPLEAGRRYRVIKAFTDHDRDVHAQGEEWTFLRSAFVPSLRPVVVRLVRRRAGDAHPYADHARRAGLHRQQSR